MRDDTWSFIGGLFLGSAISLVIGAAVINAHCRYFYQQPAIERGYARHNPQTGVWEWIEPAKKEGAE